MTQTPLSLPQPRGFGGTNRKDAWWLQPIVVFCGLSAFVVYSTWAAFQGSDYLYGVLPDQGGAHYLSPFYSPLLYGAAVEHPWVGVLPASGYPEWWPSWLPFSAALLILWAPGGFRFTCYYYRGAYYKAFAADPSNCAVGEPRSCYRGEHSLPMLLQNIHRYFLYLALIFIFILAWDAWKAMWFIESDGVAHFGLGVGSIVLTINVILLGGYTFGCHVFRHLVGGRLNILSRKPVQQKAYSCVTCLNKRHMLWAWLSLFWVGFTDFYIRMCCTEVWHDWRIF
ncbi:MAG: succinate dehydrogenase [Planctomycetota bacterium]|nr:succinate dehydrogenase [Planctomycetota bacterium]